MVTWVTEFHPHFLLIHVEILDVCDGDLSVLRALSIPLLYHQVMPVTYLAFQYSWCFFFIMLIVIAGLTYTLYIFIKVFCFCTVIHFNWIPLDWWTQTVIFFLHMLTLYFTMSFSVKHVLILRESDDYYYYDIF